jgi:hypothetical protein
MLRRLRWPACGWYLLAGALLLIGVFTAWGNWPGGAPECPLGGTCTAVGPVPYGNAEWTMFGLVLVGLGVLLALGLRESGRRQARTEEN